MASRRGSLSVRAIKDAYESIGRAEEVKTGLERARDDLLAKKEVKKAAHKERQEQLADSTDYVLGPIVEMGDKEEKKMRARQEEEVERLLARHQAETNTLTARYAAEEKVIMEEHKRKREELDEEHSGDIAEWERELGSFTERISSCDNDIQQETKTLTQQAIRLGRGEDVEDTAMGEADEPVQPVINTAVQTSRPENRSTIESHGHAMRRDEDHAAQENREDSAFEHSEDTNDQDTEQPPFKVGQSLSDEFSTVVWNGHAWVEVACDICGANAPKHPPKRSFKSLSALARHITIQHGTYQYSAEDVIRRCTQHTFSKQDVARMRVGLQAIGKEIVVVSSKDTKRTSAVHLQARESTSLEGHQAHSALQGTAAPTERQSATEDDNSLARPTPTIPANIVTCGIGLARLACVYCGANADPRTNKFFGKPLAFHPHLRSIHMQNSGHLPNGRMIGSGLSHCNVESLSEEQIQAILNGDMANPMIFGEASTSQASEGHAISMGNSGTQAARAIMGPGTSMDNTIFFDEETAQQHKLPAPVVPSMGFPRVLETPRSPPGDNPNEDNMSIEDGEIIE